MSDDPDDPTPTVGPMPASERPATAPLVEEPLPIGLLAPTVRLDLDDPGTREALHTWGGATLLRVEIVQGGRRIFAFIGARVSGDQRAGSQRGAHLSLEVAKRTRSVLRELHADPARGFDVD